MALKGATEVDLYPAFHQLRCGHTWTKPIQEFQKIVLDFQQLSVVCRHNQDSYFDAYASHKTSIYF